KDAQLGLSPLATKIVAMALGASIMLAASIRHARNVVRPVKYKGVWAGLPRTVLGFLSIAFANAALVPMLPGGHWAGVAIIPLLSAATLTYAPFPSHHLPRKHAAYIRVLIALFFLTTFGILFVKRAFFFDVLFVWMFGYTVGGWAALSTTERQAFREAVARA